MSNSTCRSCGASITWLKTRYGKKMPVNTQTIHVRADIFDTNRGHVSHFDTCRFRNAVIANGNIPDRKQEGIDR